MILEADRLGCLREVLVITAALSIQDPRERPVEHRARADQLHARFRDPRSRLHELAEPVAAPEGEAEGDGLQRVPADVPRGAPELPADPRVAGLRVPAAPGGQAGGAAPRPVGGAPDDDRIHEALLSGLLSHIGLRDAERRDYLGARGARFAIFPGSGLFKSQPDLVMAAELVETSRLWGRQNAAIDPAWAERLGGDLVSRTYSEPYWSKKRAAAMAHERVTLYGVPLVADRVVPLGRIQPDVARELFVRHALVQGEWHTRHRFFSTNLRLLEEAEELEHRARRHDIVVDEETLFDFYDERIPPEVVSGAHFDTWWKKARRDRPELLTFDPDDARPRGSRAGRGRLPRRLARGAADLPAELSLRAGARGGRRHGRRAAGHPEHRRRRPVHLERPGAAP